MTDLRRRQLPAWLIATGLAPAHPAAGAEPDAWAAEAVAPGVYMLRGGEGEVEPANRGRLGNAGFIVGDAGVIAIDTGTSYRQGRAMLAAIAAVTDKPVRLAVVTHTRQEFLFGAAAFRERGIPVAMHRRAAQLMAARCENCLKTLRRVLGEEEMRGTAMFEADLQFDDGQRLAQAGRPVDVLYFGHSSGPGDVAVHDERSGVLFAGGLVDVQRIPDVQDAQLAPWHAALAALGRRRVSVVVPGHGPAAPAAAIGVVERYLAQLEGRVRELLKADTPLSAVPDAVDLPEFAAWDGYDLIHRRNASVVFVRLEAEVLFAKPDAGDRR